jgi:hypothetical protein
MVLEFLNKDPWKSNKKYILLFIISITIYLFTVPDVKKVRFKT